MTSPDAPTRWQFWIDRGGTFTDCIGVAPGGALHVAKVLSSDRAPVEAIRRVLDEAGVSGLPPCVVRLGTTVATNALLERHGVPTLLVTNRGLGDLLHIGTQERPELFDLAVRRAPPVHARVLEVGGRVGADGSEVEPFDAGSARRGLAEARAAGLEAVAICLIHAYACPEREERLRELALEAGFPYVVASSEIAREIGMLARGETTAADAYLTPLLRSHVAALEEALPGARLRFMQSSGGLAEAAHFHGPGALLSGPAGGVVGAGQVAAAAGHARAIGFDMGGTSTDVSLIVDGEVERGFETVVAGVRVKAPMLRIHTVAAGGGSLCRFDGFRLTVGPASAGADPGPLCYGRRDASGAPRAREIALTDANLHLGRILPDRFPFPLEAEPVEAALARLSGELREAGHAYAPDELAAGFVEIANASMAQAIQEVSVRRGVDPRDFVLVGFGGAGGQHVCAVARRLGIRTVLLHPHAGLLSAWGIGVAELSWDRQRDAGRVRLATGAAALPAAVAEALAELEAEGRAALAAEGVEAGDVRTERLLDLRYLGTESPLAIREPADGDWAAAFTAEHAARFGYERPDRAIEIVTSRVRARATERTPVGEDERPKGASPHESPIRQRVQAPLGRAQRAEGERSSEGRKTPRTTQAWFPGLGRVEAPVLHREELRPGQEVAGPAILLETTGTVVLEPGFRARVLEDATLALHDEAPGVRPAAAEGAFDPADPVRLEVFGNRFMSIAEQMGAVLRNTAVSTNIKERLDYSCAVFDPEGGLVANAPHIPVHLGAMGETVRSVRADFPDLAPGDVIATNDPFRGGSHLPDVTVVTPVFLGAERAPTFFLASRGHHADLGGKSPGSMPADSTRLAEEGVLLQAFRLVRDGRLDEAHLRRLLGEAEFPARNPEDNVADMVAMVAANRAGERLLAAMVEEEGREVVAATMQELQRAAGAKVSREIDRLPDGEHRFEDRMDDGTPVAVRLQVSGGRMRIDFAGTGPASTGNLNAPRAVVQAAVIYVLRALVAERIPLNGGCLAPVEIRIPPGSLLDPPPGAAVVGGNVETSQRVVDVLLGALGRVAASQGTMNNVAFGDARFGYYETVGGGAGAGDGFPGASGVHTHMTNTRITDPEVLECRYPVRLLTFALRRGSGGAGAFPGGDGLVRRYGFLAPVTVSLLSERRATAPYGQRGGASGAPGRNAVEHADGRRQEVPGRATLRLAAGDRLVVETPGGGGYGAPP